MKLFERFKKKDDVVDDNTGNTLLINEFRVNGVYYHERDVMKLATINADWELKPEEILDKYEPCKKIYKYYFINKPVQLIFEPDNEYDKNAIRVTISGKFVGYVPADINVQIGKILKHKEIFSISSFVFGGEWKEVSDDGNVFCAEDELKIKIRIRYH